MYLRDKNKKGTFSRACFIWFCCILDGNMADKHDKHKYVRSEPSATWEAAEKVLFVGFALNAIASILIMCLIYYMWKDGKLKFNLYTKCVLQMTIYQLIYELFRPLDLEIISLGGRAEAHESSSTLRVIQMALSIMGGLGSAIWACMLLVGALFTVHCNRQPTEKEQRITTWVVIIALAGYTIPTVLAIHDAFEDKSRQEAHALWEIYDQLRLSLIGCSVLVMLRLFHIMLRTSVKGERRRHPLYHLLRKIIIYPMMLTVSRFGAISYNLMYYPNRSTEGSVSNGQIFYIFVSVLLMPIFGIGSLITFIHVTAGAGRSIIQMLHLECIFTLPDAPAAWAVKSDDHRLDRDTEVPRASQLPRELSTVQEEHDRLTLLDEDELSAEVANCMRDTRAMSANEDRGAETGIPALELHPI